MAVIQGRTRKEIRQSIGYNLGTIYVSTATGGSSSTVVDTSLTTVIGGNDDHIGKWIVFTSGALDGTIARITDYDASEVTLTFQPTAGSSASGLTYELWDGDYPPARVHDFINQSITEATGYTYDMVEDQSLHSDGYTLRFDIPTGLSMIQDIYYRDKVEFTQLHGCNTAFDEQSTLVVTTLNGAITDASATTVTVTSASSLRAEQLIMVGSEKMTISSISSNTLIVGRGAGGTSAATHSDGASVLLFPIAITESKKQGTGSNQFIIPAGASADQIVTDSITSKDISKYNYLEGWVKITRSSGTATSAGDLSILLDDTANCASPLETVNLPALTDDTWTFFRVALTNPELNTAIISVGLKYDVDLGACTVWLDDLSVTRNDTGYWRQVPRNLWRIDKQSRDIVFDEYFDGFAPYSLLKIVGGDKPALLSSDSTTNEISDSYIIERTTALAFSASSGGPNTDPDARRQQAAFWFGMAQSSKRNFPLLTNVRTVD